MIMSLFEFIGDCVAFPLTGVGLWGFEHTPHSAVVHEVGSRRVETEKLFPQALCLIFGARQEECRMQLLKHLLISDHHKNDINKDVPLPIAAIVPVEFDQQAPALHCSCLWDRPVRVSD